MAQSAWRASAWTTLAVLLACGGRSNLEAFEQGDGSGGSATTTTTTTTSSGGMGGGPDRSCLPVVPQGVRSFDSASLGLAFDPQMTLANGGDTVTLSHLELTDLPGETGVGQITFGRQPWEPATSLGTALPVGLGPLTGNVLARGPGVGFGMLAGTPMLAHYLHDAPTNMPWPPSIQLPANGPRPLFVTSEGQARLIGYASVQASEESLWLHAATSDGPHSGGAGLACANPTLDAAAVRTADNHFVLAMSNGLSYLGCLTDDDAPGPPRYLNVVRTDHAASDFELTFEADMGVPILQVEMTPRSDGAWVVWQPEGGIQPSRVQALRVDPQGSVVAGPIDLTKDGEVFGQWAIGSVSDRLVLAYIDAFDPSAPTVVLGFYDAVGQLLEPQLRYQPPHSDVWINWPLTLLGSDSELLLAFQSLGLSSNVEGSSGIFVERFACE